MTLGFFNSSSEPEAISGKVPPVPKAQGCLLPTGTISENVSKDFGITRTAQGEFAALSFVKAATAQKQGKFRNKIIPITVKFVDPKTKNKLKIVGNSSDGAAAILLARRPVANKLTVSRFSGNLPVLPLSVFPRESCV